MTNERLEQIIHDGKNKWANYHQMKEVSDELWGDVLEDAHLVCYDAVNLVFELHSSTSGMHASWHVNISPSCTIFLNKKLEIPLVGIGGTFSAALASFCLRSRLNAGKYSPKKKKIGYSEQFVTSLGDSI